MSETVAVATWTLRQIDQARGLRGKAHLDESLLHRHGDEAMSATRDELFKAMQHMAEPFAIDLDAGDLEFVTYRDDTRPFAVTVECRWHPTTNACEMRGGPHDGQIWAHQKPGEPLRIPVVSPLPYLTNADETVAEVAWADRVVTYILAGWSEKHRRWVYEVTR